MPLQFEAGWENLYDGCGQHESGAQGDEVLEVGAVPVFLDNDGAAEYVGGGGG